MNKFRGAKTKAEKQEHFWKQKAEESKKENNTLKEKVKFQEAFIKQYKEFVEDKLENAAEASEAIVTLRRKHDSLTNDFAIFQSQAYHFLHSKGLFKEFSDLINPPKEEKIKVPEEVPVSATEAEENGLSVINETSIPLDELELGGEG